MRVPRLGVKARITVLISVLCAVAFSYPFVYPAHAANFTIPQDKLLNYSEFGTGTGSGSFTRTDVGGQSVDFDFTGLTSGKLLIKDDYPVGDFYGQLLPGGHNGDFTNKTGFTMLIRNMDDKTLSMHLFINTGYTGGSGTPVNCWRNDTFWAGPWFDIPAGGTVLATLDFTKAEAWSIDDNPSPHTCGTVALCNGLGSTGTNGQKYAINTFDQGEVSAIGFEVATFDNSNPDGTLRFTPLTTPTVVYVDDSFSGSTGDLVWFPGGIPCTLGFDAFTTIEAGVDAVAAGGTVNVAPGNYPEGLVTIARSLALLGDSGSRPVVTPTQNTDHSTHRGWFQITGSGTVVDIKNFVFNGSGKLIENCIRYQSGPTGTVENCTFSNIYWAKYNGMGVVVVDYTVMGGGSPLNISPEFYIKNCTFSAIERIGMMVFGVDKGYVQNCTYTGKGTGDWLDYGVEVGGGGSAVIENGTEIEECKGVAASDGSASAGVLVTEYYGDPTIAVIDGSYLHDNTSGVAIGYGTTDASTVTVTDNDIYANDYGIGTSASPGITLTVAGNTIRDNTNGIYNESSHLVAYSNRFYGNGLNAEDDAASPNQWNHGSCPGNYWDDYMSNSGYPTYYQVAGSASSIDDCPLSIGVTLAPATTLKKCGQTITYQVMVDGCARDVMGADYKVNYDATKLTFVSAAVGSLLNTGSGEYIFTYQNLGGGVILINSAHLETGVDGPGEIAKLTFNTIGSTSPGSTALTFSETDLRDSGNQTLPSTWTGASVTIDCVIPTISVTLDAPPSPWTCYNAAPTVDISAGDDYDLDCVKYNIDSGSWVDIVCGLSGTSYTNNDWPLPGFGGLSEGPHTYYFKATDDAGNESAETSVTFTKDTMPPSAVTGFTATVGHNQIVLDWTNPGSDVDRIYLYRNDWTDYPQYATTDPGYPTVGGSYQDVGAVETYTDAFGNTTRGIYAYRAVVYDCAGNYAAAGAGDHDRATSYYLGDVASSGGSYLPNYDGLVSGFDYNPFSGCYWLRPPTGTCMEADFAPTIEPARGRFGIPDPDGYVGFEDLMIFAMNYGNVPPPAPPAPPFVGVELAAYGLVDQTLGYTLSLKDVSGTDGLVELALVVEGNDGFKGLSAEVDYDHSALEFVSVAPAEMLLSGSSRVLFMGDEVEGSVRVDLAVLGTAVAIGGNGPVAKLSFQRKGEQAGSVGIKAADARGVDNTTLMVSFTGREIQVEPGTPKVFALRGNSPNPFLGSTVVHYDVPNASPVKLTIYNVHGQAVRTLVDEATAAGRHSVTWDALDARGQLVPGGIYFCEMRSDNFVATHKMLISR